MSFSSPVNRINKKDAKSENNANFEGIPGSKQPFVFPTCWTDEERMDALMAPFRVREVNAQNYDSKMKFWQDLIGQYCDYKGSPCFCKQELQLSFARGQRVPFCLDTVLTDMQHTHKIRLRSEYEYDPLNSWKGWAINSFVKKPLWWGWQKIKTTVISPNESEGAAVEFVHLEAIKKCCKDIEEKVMVQHHGKLLHYDSFKEMVMESLQLTEDCLHLAVHTLHCQQKIGIEYRPDTSDRLVHLIKIPSKGEKSIEVTDIDRAVHNLQMTQSNLLKQLESLEEDIKQNDEKSRQYLKESKRQLAKTYLRKKHLLERNHEKLSLALHNIETLLFSVDEAQSHGEILDAYKIGAKALQKALDDSGLKYDNVDEVISEVRDVIETHKDMQDTLANANLSETATGSCDNDELELELQRIIGEDTTAAETPKPSVPAKLKNNTPAKTPQTVVITDAELLAMLEGLEVEDNTLDNAHASPNAISE